MRVGLRAAAAIGVALTVALLGMAAAFAAFVQPPPPGPFTPPNLPAGKTAGPFPVDIGSFDIQYNGFTPAALVLAEQCDGLAPTVPGYNPTIDCDTATEPASVRTDNSGGGLFPAYDINHGFYAFRGDSPQNLFTCLSPNQPAPVVTDPQFRNCQLKLTTNDTTANPNDLFMTMTLPEPVGAGTTTTTSTTVHATTTTTTASGGTTTTSTSTTLPGATTTTTSTTTTTVAGTTTTTTTRPGSTTTTTGGPSIQLGSTTVAAGQSVSVNGTGFPGGVALQIQLQSTPVNIGQATAGPSGSFQATVTIPASTAAGAHTVSVVGPAGTSLASATLTVTSAGSTVTTSGTPGGGALSLTGTNARLSVATALGLVAVGLVFVLGTWRYRKTRSGLHLHRSR